MIKGILPDMKIATKARRHKGTPRGFIIKKFLVSWCAVSWWQSFHGLRVRASLMTDCHKKAAKNAKDREEK
jgi:hypothetical protein